MSFIHVKGPAVTEYFAKLVSTAIANSAVVSFSSGYLAQAKNVSVTIAGVAIKAIASTDSDFNILYKQA